MYRDDGIFGEIRDENKKLLFNSLEHAYLPTSEDAVPLIHISKIPEGTYTCIRYMSPKHGYEVFMLKDVPGHDHCEIHIANYMKDVIGCIGIGKQIGWQLGGKLKMLTYSTQAFKEFMDLEKDVDEFQLVINS
jgi:hypothetical protein